MNAWACHHPDRTGRPEALFLTRHRRDGEHIRWAAEPTVAETGECPSPVPGTQLSAAVRISRAAGHRTAPAVRAGCARIRPPGQSPCEHTTPARYTFGIYGQYRHGHAINSPQGTGRQARPERRGGTVRAPRRSAPSCSAVSLSRRVDWRSWCRRLGTGSHPLPSRCRRSRGEDRSRGCRGENECGGCLTHGHDRQTVMGFASPLATPAVHAPVTGAPGYQECGARSTRPGRSRLLVPSTRASRK